MSQLVIDTRRPAPRKVGGGLDNPEPTPPGHHSQPAPRPGATAARRPAQKRTGDRPRRPDRTTANRPPVIEQTDTGPPANPATDPATSGGQPDQCPTGQRTGPPKLTLAASNGRAENGTAPAPATDPTGQPVDELTAVRTALAELVSAGEAVPPLRLVQIVAAKLAGHGAHCAAAINPPRGSLGVDEARTRCQALFNALTPIERHAVVALVTHDVQESNR